jgi:hypothetical protein
MEVSKMGDPHKMDGLWWKNPIKTNDFATPIKI